MDLQQIAAKVFEYAPAVAILLYLAWRMDTRLQKWADWCMEELTREINGDDNPK